MDRFLKWIYKNRKTIAMVFIALAGFGVGLNILEAMVSFNWGNIVFATVAFCTGLLWIGVLVDET